MAFNYGAVKTKYGAGGGSSDTGNIDNGALTTETKYEPEKKKAGSFNYSAIKARVQQQKEADALKATLPPEIAARDEKISAPTQPPLNSLQSSIYEKTLSPKLSKNFLTQGLGDAIDSFSGTLNHVADKVQNFFSTLDNSDPRNDGFARGAAAAELATIPVEIAFGAIGSTFKAAESIPLVGPLVKGFNKGFATVAELPSKGVDQLPISDEAKQPIKDILNLVTPVLLGKGIDVAVGKVSPVIKGKVQDLKAQVTQDLITQYNIPKTMYIDATKIRDIFQTGTKISPEEAMLVQSLGLDAAGYKNAIRNGVSIEIPASTVLSWVDKPWWARVKEIVGGEPTSKKVIIGGGNPKVGPRALLEAPKEGVQAPVAPSVKITPEEAAIVRKATPEALTESPLSEAVIERVKAFLPEQASAFGRKILKNIAAETGLNFDKSARDVSLPKNVELVEGAAPDGRPAEYLDGKIRFYPEQFTKDLQQLAEGRTILAHMADIQPVVYRLKEGESMSSLATRYFKDVMVHEMSHAKTIDEADLAKAQELTTRAIEAQQAGDMKAINATQIELQKYMAGLERKANQYARDNYTELHDELFPEAPKRPAGNKPFEKAVLKTAEKKVIAKTETVLLKKQIKDKAAGFKEGKSTGKKEGVAEGKASEAAKTEKKLEGKVIRTEKATLLDRIRNLARGAKIGFTEGKKIEAQRQRARTDMILDKIKDRRATIESIQSELLEYSRLVPANIRGRFTQRITEAKTETQFIKVLEAMKTAADVENRKFVKKEIKNELSNIENKMKNGFPTGVKFSLQEQKDLAQIKKNIKGDYLKAQEKADEILLQYAEKNESLPEAVFKQVQYLRMVGIDEMDVTELRTTLANIQSVKETGRTIRELEKFNRDSEDQRVIEASKAVIQGDKPPVGTENPITYIEEPKSIPNVFAEKLLDFFDRKNRGLENHLDALSRFDKGSLPYKSQLNKQLGRPIKNAYHKEFQGQLEWQEKMGKAVGEAYGIEKANDFDRLKNELNTPVKIAGVPFEGMFSRALAIDAYMKLQDPTLAETFEKMGWTPEVQQKVLSILKPEDKALGDKLLSLYRDYYPSINAQFLKDTGTDFPFNENYSPITRVRDPQLAPEQESGLELLMRQGMKFTTTRNSHLKARVGSTLPLKFNDPLTAFGQHIVQMEHYKAFSDPIRLMRKVFNDPEIRALIKKHHNEADLKYVLQFADDIARGSIDQKLINKQFETLKRNATRAILGYNLGPAKSQLTGILNFMIELNPLEYAKGLKDFWKDPITNSKFLIENSTVLKERFKDGYSIEVKEALEKKPDTVKKNPIFRKAQEANAKIGEHSFVFARNADRVTILSGGYATYIAKYNQFIKEGMPAEKAKTEAIAEMEDVINRTQEGSRLDTKSGLQRSGTLYDLLNMFQSQTAKFNRVLIDAMRNYKAGRGSKAEHMRTIILVWIVIPMIYQYVAKPDRSLATKLKYALLSPLTNALMVGQLATSIIGWTEKDPYSYSPSAVTSFANDLKSSISNFSNDEMAKGIAHLIDAVGKITGTPTKPLTKPIENAE